MNTEKSCTSQCCIIPSDELEKDQIDEDYVDGMDDNIDMTR